LAGLPSFAEANDYASDSDFEADDDGEDEDDDEEEENDEVLDTETKADAPAPQAAKVIHIPDTAYKTWKAMIFHLYTGNITFAPLKSARLVVESKDWDTPKSLQPDIPEVSSKSMYRLADKLGIPALENLAIKHIKSQLRVDTVCDELFSEFTSRYDKVMKTEMDFLISNWDVVLDTGRLDWYLEQLGKGKIPHALPIFIELFLRLRTTPDPAVKHY